MISAASRQNKRPHKKKKAVVATPSLSELSTTAHASALSIQERVVIHITATTTAPAPATTASATINTETTKTKATFATFANKFLTFSKLHDKSDDKKNKQNKGIGSSPFYDKSIPPWGITGGVGIPPWGGGGGGRTTTASTIKKKEEEEEEESHSSSYAGKSRGRGGAGGRITKTAITSKITSGKSSGRGGGGGETTTKKMEEEEEEEEEKADSSSYSSFSSSFASLPKGPHGRGRHHVQTSRHRRHHHHPLELQKLAREQQQQQQQLVVDMSPFLQEQASELQEQNTKQQRQMRTLQEKLAKLQDECNVTKFSCQEQYHSPNHEYLPPVDYDLPEEQDTRVGNYNLLECIGRGGFSRVYKATVRDTTTTTTCSSSCGSKDTNTTCSSCGSFGGGSNSSRVVAIKRVHKSTLDCMVRILQLDKEVQVLEMPHDNKISFVEVLHARNAIYLVMEYGSATVQSVFTYQQEEFSLLKPLKREAAIRQILMGTLSALEYLHNCNIAHLDVKPENIVLVGPFFHSQLALVKKNNKNNNNQTVEIMASNVRLCDFGFCRSFNDNGDVVVSCGRPRKAANAVVADDDADKGKNNARTAFVIGTPGFYAPEMVLPCMGKTDSSRQVKKDNKNMFSFDGPAADMWSVGATLMDLTVGFSDEWRSSYNMAAVLDRRMFEEGLFWCLQEMDDPTYFDGDADLHNFLTQGLFVQSDQRLTGQEALAHPWITRVEPSKEGTG